MISLITIHHNREKNLQNLLYGVAQQFLLPDELVIVNVGRLPEVHVPDNLNVNWVDVELIDSNDFPIGHCRNIGAGEALGELLIFLDVDCIPAPSFVKIISEQSEKYGGLIMGQPKYLPHNQELNYSDQYLINHGELHPHRPVIDELTLWNDPGMFWSLCFAISKTNYEQLGGFDQAYVGYGGEDTDLAFTCVSSKMPFFLSEAIVYHQQHPFYKPPVNHIDSIVKNCNTFYRKWNHWCMSGYLKEFADLNLIEWKAGQADPITLTDKINDFSIEPYYITDLPFA